MGNFIKHRDQGLGFLWHWNFHSLPAIFDMKELSNWKIVFSKIQYKNWVAFIFIFGTTYFWTRLVFINPYFGPKFIPQFGIDAGTLKVYTGETKWVEPIRLHSVHNIYILFCPLSSHPSSQMNKGPSSFSSTSSKKRLTSRPYSLLCSR